MFIRKNKIIIIILQPVDGATDGATRRVICPASYYITKRNRKQISLVIFVIRFRYAASKFEHLVRLFGHFSQGPSAKNTWSKLKNPWQ